MDNLDILKAKLFNILSATADPIYDRGVLVGYRRLNDEWCYILAEALIENGVTMNETD